MLHVIVVLGEFLLSGKTLAADRFLYPGGFVVLILVRGAALVF